jgi:hypothetical protein
VTLVYGGPFACNGVLGNSIPSAVFAVSTCGCDGEASGCKSVSITDANLSKFAAIANKNDARRQPVYFSVIDILYGIRSWIIC